MTLSTILRYSCASLTNFTKAYLKLGQNLSSANNSKTLARAVVLANFKIAYLGHKAVVQQLFQNPVSYGKAAFKTVRFHQFYLTPQAFQAVINYFRNVHVLLRYCAQVQVGALMCFAAFSWENDGISDSDVNRCITEFNILKPAKQKQLASKHRFSRRTLQSSNQYKSNSLSDVNLENYCCFLVSNDWEKVTTSERMHIWRKQQAGCANYEYKVFGTFTDISAASFFRVQCDTDYRKQWDRLVLQLDIVDRDAATNSEIIYWHMYYPFPMSSRDYVFVRRMHHDRAQDVMVLVSHALTTPHPKCPTRNRVVRVNTYRSDMVISPHTDPDQNGFDYLLTYYDEPQSAFPSSVYNWMAASGVHDYVEQLHQATKRLQYGDCNGNVSCKSSVSSSDESQSDPELTTAPEESVPPKTGSKVPVSTGSLSEVGSGDEGRFKKSDPKSKVSRRLPSGENRENLPPSNSSTSTSNMYLRL